MIAEANRYPCRFRGRAIDTVFSEDRRGKCRTTLVVVVWGCSIHSECSIHQKVLPSRTFSGELLRRPVCMRCPDRHEPEYLLR